MKRDIIEELQEATEVAMEKRDLERLCGNARIEITKLRVEIERLRDSRALSANVWACAYNAAVNYGSERAHKKMVRLIEAMNRDMRDEGKTKLQALVDTGVIDAFKPCPPECHMRPGGLFHAAGCENEMNHPIYQARVKTAQEKLPGGPDGWAGWRAASLMLVGK